MGPALALALALPAQEVDVTWRGDAHCQQHVFQDRLARYLANTTEGRAVAVEVNVRRHGDARWSAALALATDASRSARTLRGRSCAEVSDAAAFVTAVVVDPGVLARPADAAVVPAPVETDMSSGSADPVVEEQVEKDMSAETEDPVPRAPDPVARPAPDTLEIDPEQPSVQSDRSLIEERPEYPPGPRLAGFVRLAGGLEAFGAPRVGPLAALAVGLLSRRGWRTELNAFYRAPTTEFTAIDPKAGARVRIMAIGARGCGVPRVRRVEFPLCLGVEVGQVRGEGVGFDGRRSDRFLWAAVVAGPAVAWAPRPWFALWFGVDLAVPLLGGSFSAAGLPNMFEIAPVSLRAAVGLELRFGRARPAG